jgi:hypothetical protein
VRDIASAVAIAVTVTGALTVSPAYAADKDCGDFVSQKAAQIFFLKNGGPTKDPHRLDHDGDGIACESNPAPTYYGLTLPDGPRPPPRRRRSSSGPGSPRSSTATRSTYAWPTGRRSGSG